IRGLHLFRSRNINAPIPGIGLRPVSDFLNIDQVEASASMWSHALSVSLRGQISKRFRVTAQYTLSRTENDTSGAEVGAGFPFTLPADNFDLRAEWGRANFDQRHRFNLAGTLDLPFSFRLGMVTKLASGAPFNITTGFDNNGDTVVNDRPPGVTRNTGQGPGRIDLDLRLTKLFHLPQ